MKRFYVARLQIVATRVAGGAALVAAVALRVLHLEGPADLALGAVGAFLLVATVGARRVPVVAIDGQELRLRGLRAPHVFVLRRDAGLAIAKVDLYGVHVTGRSPWVEGLYARDGGRTLIVPTSKLAPEDRAEVEAELRRMIGGA